MKTVLWPVRFRKAHIGEPLGCTVRRAGWISFQSDLKKRKKKKQKSRLSISSLNLRKASISVNKQVDLMHYGIPQKIIVAGAEKGGVITFSDCFHLSERWTNSSQTLAMDHGHCVFLKLTTTTGNAGAFHSRRRPPEWDKASVREESPPSFRLFVIRGESRWWLIFIPFWIVRRMFGDVHPRPFQANGQLLWKRPHGVRDQPCFLSSRTFRLDLNVSPCSPAQC